MREVVFALVLASLAVAAIRTLISILWPERRLWPPPENPSAWQAALGRFGALGSSLGVPLVAIFDWNGFVLHHPSRFLVGAALVAFGGSAISAYRRLGASASVARAPVDGRLELVVDGPYRDSRNPQYAGAIMVYLGVAVAANSGLALIAALAACANFFAMPFAEEPWLRERFGDAYRVYARQVPRFLSASRARLLMLICLIALPLDFIVSWLPGVVYPGYDPVTQYMSELAVPGRPGHDPLTVWWMFYGASLVTQGGLWRSTLRGVGLRAWLAAALLMLAGLGLGILTSLYPCDEGCAGLTRSGALHQTWGLIGGLALTGAPFAFCWAFWGDPRWQRLRPLSLVAGLGMLLAMGAQVAASTPNSPLSGIPGIVQRATLLWAYLWLLWIGARWLRTNAPALPFEMKT